MLDLKMLEQISFPLEDSRSGEFVIPAELTDFNKRSHFNLHKGVAL